MCAEKTSGCGVLIILECKTFQRELENGSFVEGGLNTLARDLFCATLCPSRKTCSNNAHLSDGRTLKLGTSDQTILTCIELYLREKMDSRIAGERARELLPVVKYHIDAHKYFHEIPDYMTGVRHFLESFYNICEKLEEALKRAEATQREEVLA